MKLISLTVCFIDIGSHSIGIAHRWNSPNPQDFSYRLNTKDQLKKMSLSDLRQLSPAEKYDIYIGELSLPSHPLFSLSLPLPPSSSSTSKKEMMTK
jgi:hypothetical protein